MAVEWYKTAEVSDIPLVWDNGEEALQAVPLGIARGRRQPARGAHNHRGRGDQRQLENESLSFDTTAIGVPHWIKISYFPNWHVKALRGRSWLRPR